MGAINIPADSVRGGGIGDVYPTPVDFDTIDNPGIAKLIVYYNIDFGIRPRTTLRIRKSQLRNWLENRIVS